MGWPWVVCLGLGLPWISLALVCLVLGWLGFALGWVAWVALDGVGLGLHWSKLA